jgi:hypothetical protein
MIYLDIVKVGLYKLSAYKRTEWQVFRKLHVVKLSKNLSGHDGRLVGRVRNGKRRRALYAIDRLQSGKEQENRSARARKRLGRERIKLKKYKHSHTNEQLRRV